MFLVVAANLKSVDKRSWRYNDNTMHVEGDQAIDVPKPYHCTRWVHGIALSFSTAFLSLASSSHFLFFFSCLSIGLFLCVRGFQTNQGATQQHWATRSITQPKAPMPGRAVLAIVTLLALVLPTYIFCVKHFFVKVQPASPELITLFK